MDVSQFVNNSLSNMIFRSSTACSNINDDRSYALGIDEAGRGPVLGPMVYSAFFCADDQLQILTDLGCADSKQLTEERRTSIFAEYDQHRDHLGFVLKVLSPHMISTSMLRREKYNLNDISHDAAMELIQLVVQQGVNVQQVFVDTVGDPEKYANKIRSRFPKIKVTVSKKADSLFPIVSASSICAKVIRDQIVQTWKLTEFDETKEILPYGSGYPGDPQTKRFLNESLDHIFGFPKFVRFSWSTASTMIEKSCMKISWDDDDEEENLAKVNPSKKRKSDVMENNSKNLLSYFAPKTPVVTRRISGSHFFRAAHLHPVQFAL